MTITRQHKLWFALAATLASHAVQAQLQLERLSVRAGIHTIRPDVTSGDLSAPSLAHTTIDVHNATQLSGGLNYALTDNVAIDLPLGLPFKHDVVGDGAIAGVGKLGSVKSSPITVMLQYRFGTPTSSFRPYLGAGMTYARFYKSKATAALSGLTGGSPSKPTTLSMDDAAGGTLQAGALYAINSKWFVDGAVHYVKIRTTGQLSTGQTIKTRLDPTAFSISLGYKF